MGDFIMPSDLEPFADIPEAKALAMIEDAEAQALLIAPCLSELEQGDAKLAAVRSILRGALLRWNDAGSGAIQQTQVGPFGQSIDTRQHRKGMFWPSEINDLQGICETGDGMVSVAISSGRSGSYRREV